jgi:PAS domain S-box-containing protein
MDITPNFFEKILQICPDGVIGNDLKGNIHFFNASAERLLGYQREEVLGKINVTSLYPAGGAREVKEFLYSEEYGGRGRLVDFETEVVRKDGKRVPIRISCVLRKTPGNRGHRFLLRHRHGKRRAEFESRPVPRHRGVGQRRDLQL